MTTVIVMFLVGTFCIGALVAGVVYYLKKRGVLRAAANAAVDATKTAVTQDVAKVVEPPKG